MGTEQTEKFPESAHDGEWCLVSQARVEERFPNTWDKTAVTKRLYLSKNVEENMILMKKK